jgi:uncharacterized membrane protein (UPF0127 family)
MNAQLKLLLYICLVVGMLYYVQQKYNLFEISFDNKESKQEEVENKIQRVEIINEDGGSIYVEVEIADTNELRRLGLSGRTELGDYQGMLFIMDTLDTHSFWMKDMEISLDILFIDSNGKVVDIFENQKPCTPSMCPSIQSPFASKYVLEVVDGFVGINRVEVGNEVVFDISFEE